MSQKEIIGLLVAVIMVSGFLTVPVWGMISVPALGEVQQSAADTNGPEFDVPFGNLSIDFSPDTAPQNISLTLRAEVTDPDGVDTVIGSYRLDEETIWHNKTLSYTPREGYPNLYSAFVMNRTLCSGDWGGKWYFKFYANDTLGNWNSSSVWFESFFGGAASPRTQSIFLNPLVWIALVASVLAIAIIVREISSMRCGTMLKRSPTMPKSATSKIGASGSMLIVIMRSALFLMNGEKIISSSPSQNFM